MVKQPTEIRNDDKTINQGYDEDDEKKKRDGNTKTWKTNEE